MLAEARRIAETYVRIGNEAVVTPEYILNELILKGTNRSFDAVKLDISKEKYSFTLLEATYRNPEGVLCCYGSGKAAIRE